MPEINDKTRESVTAGLHELLNRLRTDKDQLDARIKQIENDLLALGDKTVSIKGKRRKWGANRQLVEDYLKNNPSKSFSIAALASLIGIARSSVGSALMKIKSAGHAEELPDNMWRYK